MKPVDYLNSSRYSNLTLAVAFFDMAYIFDVYVKNRRAYNAARVVSFLYSVNFPSVAQFYHSHVLSRVVEAHEWHLCSSYGKKNGFTS